MNKVSRLTVFVLCALFTVSPFSIDLYLPAFQQMATDFHVTTARVSLTLSSYFVGLALGQISYGPFLDRFGRRKPIYFGLTLYLFSTIACYFSNSLTMLVVGRFFQALGGSAAQVGCTAMVGDFFAPDKRARIFSILMLSVSVSPLFAPTIGGLIVSAFGWRATFAGLAIIVSIIFFATVLLLPEEGNGDANISLSLVPILKTFISLIKIRPFFTYTLASALSFAGLFVYLAGAPSILMGQFHLSTKTFGMVFALLSIGVVGGGQFNIFLEQFFSTEKIFRAALTIQVAVSVLFFVSVLFHVDALVMYITTFALYLMCIGLTYPNGAALALAPITENMGSASALLGFFQMGLGALFSGLVGALKFQPSVSVSLLFFIPAGLGLIYYWYMACSIPPSVTR